MNPYYNIREGEDQYEYGLRLIETKVENNPSDLEWQDIVEALGLDCHYDTLRKAANTTPYSGYAVMQHYKRKALADCTYSTEDYLSEIEDKLLELQKERQRFYDQRREYNAMVRNDSRQEYLDDRLVEAAKNLNETVGTLFGESEYLYNTSDKEAVLVLCDWHYGMVTNNIWNTYNTQVCKERVKKTVEMAIDRLILHKCKVLHIVLLGDAAHGAIHVSARVASEELVCDQIMQVSEILAQAINRLSAYAEVTKVYSTYGNHLRTVQNKNDSIHRDNMERLIPWWLRQRLADNPHVEIVEESENEFILFDVCGHGICATHGDLDNVKSSPRLLPTLFQRKLGHNIEYILLADKHHIEGYEELGAVAKICDALCGTDDYANGKRLYSTPGQTMMIFDYDGLDAEYHFRLG